MIVRSLDTNDDWTFGRGQENYASGNAAVGQSIFTRLRMFLGDCFFAIDEGIDWFNLLGSKNQLAIELSVKATIVQTEGVSGLISLFANLDRRTRGLSLGYSVQTFFKDVITRPMSLLLTEDGDFIVTEDGDNIQA